MSEQQWVEGAPGAANDDPDLHPLFWRPGYMPENHPETEALQSFIDECTPEERAMSAKDAGNEYLKNFLQMRKKVVLAEALKEYAKALEFEHPNDQLRGTIYSNRAQAQSLQQNWRSALEDAERSISYDPTNVKSHFRGARAALKLLKFEICAKLCDAGIALDPANAELPRIRAQSEAAAAEEAKRQEAARLREAELAAPFQRLADAIHERGIRMTRPQMEIGDKRPHLDEDGALHFPVLFCLPEAMQTDAVEDVHELDCLDDHLDVMFGADAPPLPWDEAGEYTRDRLELYYLSYAGTPLEGGALVAALQRKSVEGYEDAGPSRYGAEASHWVPLPRGAKLLEVLQGRDCVVPGVPMFFVVAKGTEYRERFLREELRPFSRGG